MAATPQQAQIRDRYVGELGLDESIIHQETLHTNATKGPTYLTTHPDYQSTLAARKVMVHTLEQLKTLAGFADEHYEQGLLEEHHQPLDEWPAEQNGWGPDEITYLHRSLLCKASKAYVYGCSKRVQSYREILQKFFFPMEIAVFVGTDLHVYPGSPLIVLPETPDQPVGIGFDTIVLHPGAQVINMANSKWAVNRLVQLQEDGSAVQLDVGNFCNIGEDGYRGDAGSPGGNGATGMTGSPAVDKGNGSHGFQAGQGGAGAPGRHGRGGGNGSRGQDSQPVELQIGVLEGPLVLVNHGGTGGDGGNGGCGGAGGIGGPGGAGTDHFAQGRQGQGGVGGHGGKGGDGGHGGDADAIYLSYLTMTEGSSITVIPSKGRGAHGGTGGVGGRGGVGDPNGIDGLDGEAGNSGDDGRVGAIFVNGKRIEVCI